MDSNTIRVIDDRFNFLGDIEDYISFYFVRNYYKAKEFQIVAPIKYQDILINGNIIFITPKKPGIIEEVSIDESKGEIIAKGKDLKSILNRRITIPPTGEDYDSFKGTAESVIKHYIEVNAVNSEDSNRNIIQLVVAENKNRGQQISYQSRLKELGVEIENIALASGLGYNIELDLINKKFVFDVFQGRDLTVNNRVMFSSEFDNLYNTTHIRNSLSYKTMAFVAGQGEGADRNIKQIYKTSDSGLSRRELYIDARDINENQSLEDRANMKLKEYENVISTESTIDNYSFVYEKDWDLGDIVIRKTSKDIDSLRVVEVTEVYEGYMKVDITLGSIINSPIDDLNNKVSDIQTSNGVSGGGSVNTNVWKPVIDVNGVLTWEYTLATDIPTSVNIKGPKGDTGPQGPAGEGGTKIYTQSTEPIKVVSGDIWIHTV
ncbi:MAG: siphovirus ReqiPepy6 Gp37-like family protein [Peptostreptococcaceae bacterium]